MMPKVSGLQVLREIRCGRTKVPRDIPVGLLTSANDQRTVGQAVQLDCDAFIVKPMNRAVLFSKIEQLLARAERALHPPEFYDAVDVGAISIDQPETKKIGVAGPKFEMAMLAVGKNLQWEVRTEKGDLVVPRGRPHYRRITCGARRSGAHRAAAYYRIQLIPACPRSKSTVTRVRSASAIRFHDVAAL